MTAHEFSIPWYYSTTRIPRRALIKGAAAASALLFKAGTTAGRVLPALQDTTLVAAATGLQKVMEATTPTRDQAGNFLQLQIACAMSENARKVFQRSAESFKDHEATQRSTVYSDSARLRTQTVTVGDSIARGFLERQVDGKTFEPKPYQRNVAGNKTGAMNASIPDARWVWHNNSQDNSTGGDTLLQFDHLEIDYNPAFSTDFIISVGGNDMRHRMEHIWQQVQPMFAERKLKANDIIDFSNQAVEAINSFKETFEQILRAVLKQKEKGIRVQRIFIESLANISVLEGILLNNETFLQIHGNIINETVARNLCTLTNNAITEAIDALGTNPGCDILLMNNFDMTAEDFTGSHPNEKGQQKMTRAQLARSLVRLPTGTQTTLLDVMEKKGRPVAYRKQNRPKETVVFAWDFTPVSPALHRLVRGPAA